MADSLPLALRKIHFTPPPEALVYRPTIEEFKDPLAYINRIRPTASKFGICKIVPPDDWQPPFAVNADKLTFSPRIQKLNELEATTRIKLLFLDKIVKFWYLQGTTIKLPTVESKILDLFTLHKLVGREGGFLKVCEKSKWSDLAAELEFNDAEGKAGVLKAHYEKLLYPFEIFEQNKKSHSGVSNTQHAAEKEDDIDEDEGTGDVSVKDEPLDFDDHIDIVDESLEIKQELIEAVEEPHVGVISLVTTENEASTSSGTLAKMRRLRDERELKTAGQKRSHVPSRIQPTRSSKRLSDSSAKSSPPKNKELKRLEFFGAGPKMAGFAKAKVDTKGKTRGKKSRYVDPLAKYVCVNCSRGDKEAFLLLCDGCDDSYHTFCLIPSLNAVPKGDWRCPKCVAVVVDRPIEPYGFAQSKRVFTLQEFGAMADEFKSNYFHKPVHHVETHVVESEFWKLVSSIDHDVTVLYGADLHTMDLGSGFPTVNHAKLLKCEREYVLSGWNLNNMPVLQRSVLSHINANISGMKVPWMYVGMCFSTFCWHNEDHWSYSINYLHWGEPKTWYGVPGDRAEDFEATMKEAAPELFESQPDLLHQLVTIMNPNVFILKGIPVYRTDQHAGEFVITFPRAYHAGFNQGYNFAEAVNFAPADWLEMGRLCVAHYAKCRRFCVFSHDELVCRMAMQADQLDLTMAMATFMDVKIMVAEEKKLRRAMLDYGIKKSEMCAFELLPDDERQCDICKTTCFLSAIKCPCSGKRIVCLQHFQGLCDCSPENLILKYRYKSSEFVDMLQNLRDRFQPFTAWHVKTKSIFDLSAGEKQDISTLRSLLQEAIQGQYPSDATLQDLKRALAKAEVIMDLTEKLSFGKYLNQISLECFQEVVDDLKKLPCEIVNSNIILETLEQTLKLQQESRILLNEEHPDSKELEKCINTMGFAPIELPEFRKLKQKLEQVNWLDEVRNIDGEGCLPSIENIKNVISSGSQLPPHPHVEGVMSKLQERLTKMEAWEKKVNSCLEEDTKQTLPYLEGFLKEASSMKGFLPSRNILTDIVKEAKLWFSKVNDIKVSPYYPYIQTIEKLANEGRPMRVKFDVLKEMELLMNRAKLWLDKAETTFLRKHAHYSLLEALCPRRKVGITTYRCRKRRNREEVISPCCPNIIPVDQPLSPEDLVTSFKNFENNEVEIMKVLRRENLMKRKNDTGEATYCICLKEYSEGMLHCELCKDYFHASCVPVIKVPNRTKQQASFQQLSNAAAREKFLCPCCMRSRRPRLDAILPLLVGLQELPLRIPEGEALQILTERTMNWQDKARQALDTEELTAALAKLSVLSKRINEAAAREKTEKIITTELKKAANNPELHCKVKSISSLSGISEDSHLKRTNTDKNIHQPNEGEELPEQSGISAELKDANGSFSSSEHAYSSASKSADIKGKKHSRKSPLVPRQLEPPVLSLSEEGLKTLEELMVEGDLLEISVDEASFIWRILQATRPRKEDRFPEFEEEENSGKACSKQRRRKRRPDDGKETEENKKVKTVKSGSLKRSPLTSDKKDLNVKKSEDCMKSIACEDLSDNDEDCAAEPCRKPTGRELLWVQCDGCNAWYHLHCIGLKKENLKDDQDFLCPVCRESAMEEFEEESQSNPGKVEGPKEISPPVPIAGALVQCVGGPAANTSVPGIPATSGAGLPELQVEDISSHMLHRIRLRQKASYGKLADDKKAKRIKDTAPPKTVPLPLKKYIKVEDTGSFMFQTIRLFQKDRYGKLADDKKAKRIKDTAPPKTVPLPLKKDRKVEDTGSFMFQTIRLFQKDRYGKLADDKKAKRIKDTAPPKTVPLPLKKDRKVEDTGSFMFQTIRLFQKDRYGKLADDKKAKRIKDTAPPKTVPLPLKKDRKVEDIGSHMLHRIRLRQKASYGKLADDKKAKRIKDSAPPKTVPLPLKKYIKVEDIGRFTLHGMTLRPKASYGKLADDKKAKRIKDTAPPKTVPLPLKKYIKVEDIGRFTLHGMTLRPKASYGKLADDKKAKRIKDTAPPKTVPLPLKKDRKVEDIGRFTLHGMTLRPKASYGKLADDKKAKRIKDTAPPKTVPLPLKEDREEPICVMTGVRGYAYNVWNSTPYPVSHRREVPTLNKVRRVE